MLKEAMYYDTLGDGTVKCNLCPHNCIIKEGNVGRCNVKKVCNGKLYSLNYGEITAGKLDPIEKKPFNRYKPGSHIFSVGTFGCNFHCEYCQNYVISQDRPESEFVEPDKLIAMAHTINNNIGIAFTYNEPIIWYEYIKDVCELNNYRKLDIALVTNGYINKEPFEAILPYIDAIKIDLKSFSRDFYMKICNGSIEPVMENIKLAYAKTHLEIATLIVNGYNDSVEEIENMSKWIASIDKNIPLQLMRYYPRYKFKVPETSMETMYKCRDVAKKYLNYVYL